MARPSGARGFVDLVDAVLHYCIRPMSGVLSNETPQRFHIHTIVRTPNGNDYGMDLLRLHYETAPHHRKHAGHAERVQGATHGAAVAGYSTLSPSSRTSGLHFAASSSMTAT